MRDYTQIWMWSYSSYAPTVFRGLHDCRPSGGQAILEIDP